MTFKKILFIVVTLTNSSFNAFSEDGKTIFKTNCASCHTIGNGKLVGPDLKDVDKRHPEAWLMKWIKSSQALIKSGDADATAIFNNNNKIPMTDFSFLSDEQIKSTVGYIQSESTPQASAPPSVPVNAAPAPVQMQDINKSAWELSFTHYLLLGIIVILLLVIWQFSSVIKQLANELIISNKIKKKQ